jgi:hypothetical protein
VLCCRQALLPYTHIASLHYRFGCCTLRDRSRLVQCADGGGPRKPPECSPSGKKCVNVENETCCQTTSKNKACGRPAPEARGSRPSAIAIPRREPRGGSRSPSRRRSRRVAACGPCACRLAIFLCVLRPPCSLLQLEASSWPEHPCKLLHQCGAASGRGPLGLHGSTMASAPAALTAPLARATRITRTPAQPSPHACSGR